MGARKRVDEMPKSTKTQPIVLAHTLGVICPFAYITHPAHSTSNHFLEYSTYWNRIHAHIHWIIWDTQTLYPHSTGLWRDIGGTNWLGIRRRCEVPPSVVCLRLSAPGALRVSLAEHSPPRFSVRARRVMCLRSCACVYLRGRNVAAVGICWEGVAHRSLCAAYTRVATNTTLHSTIYVRL